MTKENRKALKMMERKNLSLTLVQKKLEQPITDIHLLQYCPEISVSLVEVIDFTVMKHINLKSESNFQRRDWLLGENKAVNLQNKTASSVVTCKNSQVLITVLSYKAVFSS